MRILALTDLSLERDPAVGTAQALACWTGGEWHVVHALSWRDLGPLARPGRHASAVLARQLRTSAPDAPAAATRAISCGSLVTALRRVPRRIRADLLVLHADRVYDERSGWSVREVIEATDVPVLIVCEPVEAPPAHGVVVTEQRDLERGVMDAALHWMQRLRGVHATAAGAELQVTSMHAVRATFDWSDAQPLLRDQLRAVSIPRGVTLREMRPWRSAELPAVIDQLETDIVVLFHDVRGTVGLPRVGELLLRVLQRSTTPVLVLPPGPELDVRRFA